MGYSLDRIREEFAKTRFRVGLIWLRHRNLDPQIWWRHRGLDAEDVFVASYPRSGFHWLRFQLIEILTGRSAQFDTMDEVIPIIGRHSKVRGLLPRGGRLIQTHEKYRSEYKRALYLVRDVRDVVISGYSYDKKSSLFYTDCFERYLWAFVKGKAHGFGPWHEHIFSWLNSPAAKAGDVLVVRYEDMRANTEETLAKVVRFLGVDVNREVIRHAVRNNTLERMRAKQVLSPKYNLRGQVRKGAVDGWRQELTAEQVRIIEHFAGSALMRLGYPTGTAALDKDDPHFTSPVTA